MSLLNKHGVMEKNSILLLICILIVVAIGGIVEIAPLFYLDSTIEKVKGMRPYTPLELAGRDIYVREGCYNCHSQMIRSTRDEVERYGHYSLAAESMYDHPHQWGSKRTGPDIARLGNKYSDLWHQEHMKDPRAVVPQSIMPGYPFLATTKLDYRLIQATVRAHQIVGVPYTDEQVKNAASDLESQLNEDHDGFEGFEERWPNVIAVRDFDGNKKVITELDALIAYLQMLGTLVDFNLYDENDPDNQR